MKKRLSLTLTGALVMLAMCFAGAACNKNNDKPVDPPPVNNEITYDLYLVPGTYISDGATVENAIPSGATKLTDEQCAEIYKDNVYKCTLDLGAALPVPTSTRTDADGNPYSFNGWWTIVNATVTYFDKVPSSNEDTLFLYADWRADLSQPKDPVAPDPGKEVERKHYMSIVRAETGETEIIALRAAGTDVASAEQLGYGYAVQLYAQFTVNPGDQITVYTTGMKLSSAEEPVKAPYADKNYPNRTITLEANGTGTNDTADWVVASGFNYRETPVLTVNEGITGKFNIYIKFLSGGNTMTVYMERPS